MITIKAEAVTLVAQQAQTFYVAPSDFSSKIIQQTQPITAIASHLSDSHFDKAHVMMERMRSIVYIELNLQQKKDWNTKRITDNLRIG